MSNQTTPNVKDSDAELRCLLENFDPHSPIFAARREEVFAAMHAGCPVLKSNKYGGFAVFGRYQTVVDIHADQANFSNEHLTIPKSPIPRLIPGMQDEPEHRAYRNLLQPLLAGKAIAAKAERTRELARSLISAGIAKTEFDMVLDVAQPLTGILTMELLGLNTASWLEYVEPIHAGTFHVGTDAEIAAGWQGLLASIRQDVARQRTSPKGALGVLTKAKFMGRLLTDEELEIMTLNVLIGGLGTTQGFVGSMVVHLGRHPDHRQQLIDQPSLRHSAIDEMLRFYAPQTLSGRVVRNDVEVEGVSLKSGSQILIGYAPGNFDPDKFEAPFEVNFARQPNRHMTFGIGAHTCLGRNLARLVIENCLDELLLQAPDFGLVEGKCAYVSNIAHITGYRSVVIRV